MSNTATLIWTPVTENTDGTLAEGVTYRIYQNGTLVKSQLTSTNYEFTNLPYGTTCWQVQAVENNEPSALSNEVCKTFHHKR